MRAPPHQDTAALLQEGCNVKSDTKVHAVLSRLLHGSANRFEAERIGDHCLNSTVPQIERRGITIARERETVPCCGGTKTVSVKRYWVERTAHNMDRARRILAGLAATDQATTP